MKLPLNCTVDYLSDFLTQVEADDLYNALLDRYQIDQARIVLEVSGKTIETDSFKILFATEDLLRRKSHPEEIHGKSFPFTGLMAQLKNKVEKLLNREFDLAMCLYYPDGNYFAPYHSDQETSGYNTILPSISLGVVRTFSFRENESEECYDLDLANGSVLVMGAYCQSRYTHSLLKNPEYKKGRINITFRDGNFQ